MIITLSTPDIPAPTNPFVGYWGKRAFLGDFSKVPVVASLSATFVRCVFGAREDYLAAIAHLRNYYGKSGHQPIQLSELYRCVTRFEACITAMYLAVRSMQALRKCPDLVPREREALCASRPKPGFLGAGAQVIGNLRNRIQHVEEELATGRLDGDLATMIYPTGTEVPFEDGINQSQTLMTIDRLRVYDSEVSFAQIATWLQEMISYVEKLHDLMPIEYTSTRGMIFKDSLAPPSS
ncbi:hypothetical protein [Pandoraea sp. ISTKB]|uniref:hypothetical protein n=1 Tax=Pandoraea sp. ISTKB TaxID=1586708 RepID=UPI000846C266|nr:hypothetical protein [Pandoraea sp. ISTKB]ODP35000.1 hypothetical protein A9762_11580 [Pandoraea sp. ISTKB]